MLDKKKLVLMLFIALAAGIGGLAIVAMVTGIKSSKEKINKMKFELDTDRPIDKTYKFLLKTYSGINNLSILNAVENKSIETELKTIGIGYYTSTHSTSGGGSYNTTRPYTYTIRYSAKVSFDQIDGKTHIKMDLKPGKMYRGVMISVIMFLIFGVAMGGMFIAIGGIGVEFLQGFGFIMFIVMGLISLLMALLMPRVTVKQYKRTANDQFQLLVKKPVIALQLGTEEAKAAIQFTQVTKTEAKQQPDASFCPYCGKGINPGAKYCEGCGSEIV